MTGIIDAMLDPPFVAVNLSYVALVVAAFCKSHNRMRLLLVFAAVCFIVYGALQNIASIVVWNIVTGALNLSRLAASGLSEARTALTTEEETLRQLLFPNLPPAEFLELWALGGDVYCVDELLLEARSTPDRLLLLVRGTVEVERDGEVVEVLHPGAVIGHLDPYPFSELAADWRAAGAVWLRSWARSELSNPDLPAQIRRLLVADRPGLVRAQI
ncbi:MAG: hypothetical protein ACRBK7_25875 [Acidimicrobiales bacterium]